VTLNEPHAAGGVKTVVSGVGGEVIVANKSSGSVSIEENISVELSMLSKSEMSHMAAGHSPEGVFS
jgi:hypothetical protein